jgi:hypothetical protein
MEELDREIERLEAENEGTSASTYTFPLEREDSYETPSDIGCSRSSSPLSVLSGYSAMSLVTGIITRSDFSEQMRGVGHQETEVAIEPASELSIGSVIVVDSRPRRGRRGRV